jgi:hypothetical protein
MAACWACLLALVAARVIADAGRRLFTPASAVRWKRRAGKVRAEA